MNASKRLPRSAVRALFALAAVMPAAWLFATRSVDKQIPSLARQLAVSGQEIDRKIATIRVAASDKVETAAQTVTPISSPDPHVSAKAEVMDILDAPQNAFLSSERRVDEVLDVPGGLQVLARITTSMSRRKRSDA